KSEVPKNKNENGNPRPAAWPPGLHVFLFEFSDCFGFRNWDFEFGARPATPHEQLSPRILPRCVGPITGGEFVVEFLLLARFERADEFHFRRVHIFILCLSGYGPVAREVPANI